MEHSMTRLARILAEQKTTYTSVAERAQLQPRTVRQLATGERPIDNVAVGTVRKIASALSVPVVVLLEDDAAHPGDPALDRTARLSAAIRSLTWAASPMPYSTPVEAGPRDEIGDLAPDELFVDMPPIDARRG
jgi:transcriptional regulator with XRE-family HTH domain